MNQLDVNSWRERAVHSAFGVKLFSTSVASDFTSFAQQHFEPLGKPEWRSYHYSEWFVSARLYRHYRHGRLVQQLRSLRFAIDAMRLLGADLSVEDEVRLLRAARDLIADRSELQVQSVFVPQNGQRRIQILDDAGEVVATWKERP